MLVVVMLLQEPLGGLAKDLISFQKLRQSILNISSHIMTMLDSGKDRFETKGTVKIFRNFSKILNLFFQYWFIRILSLLYSPTSIQKSTSYYYGIYKRDSRTFYSIFLQGKDYYLFLILCHVLHIICCIFIVNYDS